MKKSINQIQDEIIAECAQFKDWFETYAYLINQGKQLIGLDESMKTDDNTISGCQSMIWIKTERKQNRLFFKADSDSKLVKGMIALLLRVVNNKSPEAIDTSDLYFIKEIGLDSHLSPKRSSGLNSVINYIKTTAQSELKDQNNLLLRK